MFILFSDFKGGSPRSKHETTDPAKSFINKSNVSMSNSNMSAFPQYMSMPQTPMYYKPGLTSTFSPSGAYSYNMTSPRNPLHTPSLQNSGIQDDQSEQMDTSLSVSELHTEELPPRQPIQQQPLLRLPSHTMNGYPSPIRSSFLSHQPSSITESVLPLYNSHLSSGDQTRQVALLLSELDAAKHQNKKVKCLYNKSH